MSGANSTVKIDAIGVPVAAEVYAKPGDTLLLFNGVCIGVQRAATDKTSPRSKAATLLIEAPKPPRKRTKGTERDKLIAEALADGPLDTAHLLDRLKIDVKSLTRKVMTQYVGKAAQRGFIEATPSTRHKVKKTWRLPRPPSAAPRTVPIDG